MSSLLDRGTSSEESNVPEAPPEGNPEPVPGREMLPGVFLMIQTLETGGSERNELVAVSRGR